MKKAKLLVADDDRVILVTLVEGLEEAGYDVISASDGAGAVEQCKKNKPDLALLDIRMPNMSGLEAAKIIKEETNVPFLFLSAYRDKEFVEEAASQGGMGYLVKPVDVPNIIPSVESALNRSRELEELRTCKNQLTEALNQDRSISVAVGLVMERHRYSETQAFEYLRSRARSRGEKLSQLAKNLIDSTESINNAATDG